ncbi:hypothetical protein DFH28DRAFT_920604 [Melampsora americana]|nr:hypothetical protein DFH28DRAFT_920604 [Melampsora americana]
MVVEWNREPTPLDKFGGGFVLPPKQGVHKNVVVFDFSSMYPSIIVSANISSESVVTVTSEEEMSYWDERFSGGEIRSISSEITLKYDDEYICLQIGEQMGIIKRRVRSISCEVMKYLMDTRNSLEDRSGPQGWALKIGANSYYGALGSYTSGIGKRFAAACVTALGRLAIERLVKFLSELGHETLYGDTDSVFIKCSIGDLDGEISHSEMIEDTLKAYHNSLKGTVFEGIVLKYELTYDSLILLKRKMYFGIVADSKKVVVKGMASKRRDRPNISREVSMYVCNKICEIEDRSVLIKVLADYCHEIYLKVINGECSPYESMLETKEGSVLVWRYRAVDGTFVSVEKDKFVDSKHNDRRQDVSYNDVLKTNDWKKEAFIGGNIEEMLMLRRNMQTYTDNSYACSNRLHRNLQPETAFATNFDTLHIPRSFPPIYGFPVKFENEFFTCGLVENDSVCNDIVKVVDVMASATCAWVAPGLSIVNLSSDKRYKSFTEFVDKIPLHAFSLHALNERMLYAEETSPWNLMYDTMIDVRSHTGIYGIVQDNSLIDMRPFEMESIGTEIERDTSLRETKENWRNFISPTYTPASLEAGRIRTVSYGVGMRLMTKRMLDFMRWVGTKVKERAQINRKFELHFMGTVNKISITTCMEITSAWTEFKGIDAPTLYLCKERCMMFISISSGCLVRPASQIENFHRNSFANCRWFDSVMYNDNNKHVLGSLVGCSKPNFWTIPNTFNMLYPFMRDDDPPRPLLGCSMSVQALCKPRTELSSTVAPIRSYLPIVRTPLMQQFIEKIKDNPYMSIPGVPMLVVFCNMTHNYEDALIMEEGFSKSDHLKHRGVIYHQIPIGTKRLKRGDIISNKPGPNQQHWWRPSDDGIVVYEGMGKTKVRYVCANMESSGARIGDKFGTPHGQKFVLSQILSRDKMPSFQCRKTGTVFKPHVIIASSSIHKRGTMGQLYEAWQSFNVVEDFNFQPGSTDRSMVIDPVDFKVELIEKRDCYCLDSNSNIVLRDERSVSADFGICTLWPLVHLVRDKQQYVSKDIRGINVPKGRLNGGSVRMGEMELQTMYTAGLIYSLNEMIENSDLITVDTCPNCRRLSMICDCNEVAGSTVKVIVRESIAKFDIYRATYGVNAAMGSEQDEIVDEAKHIKEPIPCESFQYLT